MLHRLPYTFPSPHLRFPFPPSCYLTQYKDMLRYETPPPLCSCGLRPWAQEKREGEVNANLSPGDSILVTLYGRRKSLSSYAVNKRKTGSAKIHKPSHGQVHCSCTAVPDRSLASYLRAQDMPCWRMNRPASLFAGLLEFVSVSLSLDLDTMPMLWNVWSRNRTLCTKCLNSLELIFLCCEGDYYDERTSIHVAFAVVVPVPSWLQLLLFFFIYFVSILFVIPSSVSLWGHIHGVSAKLLKKSTCVLPGCHQLSSTHCRIYHLRLLF